MFHNYATKVAKNLSKDPDFDGQMPQKLTATKKN